MGTLRLVKGSARIDAERRPRPGEAFGPGVAFCVTVGCWRRGHGQIDSGAPCDACGQELAAPVLPPGHTRDARGVYRVCKVGARTDDNGQGTR